MPANEDQLDIREMRDGTWQLSFPYEADFIAFLKGKVPACDRAYDPDTNIWTIKDPSYLSHIESLGLQKFSPRNQDFLPRQQSGLEEPENWDGICSGESVLKALSLWQPWASLIADGRKKVETRHWEMLYRGQLAIHAAKKVDRTACVVFGYDPDAIPRGAILCIVNVDGCVRFPHDSAPPDVYGDFAAGRFGILMTLLDRFEKPIPTKGRQGLWNWVPPWAN